MEALYTPCSSLHVRSSGIRVLFHVFLADYSIHYYTYDIALYRKSLNGFSFWDSTLFRWSRSFSLLKSDGDILLVIKALIFSLALTISHGHKTCRHILQRNYLCLQSSYLDVWVPDCIHKSGTWTSKWSKLHLQQFAPKMSKKDVADRKRVQRCVMRIIRDMENLRNETKWNRIGLFT